MIYNNKMAKCCALCKHWWNPSGEGITPVRGSAVLIDVDKTLCKHCKIWGNDRKAFACCPKFERKY